MGLNENIRKFRKEAGLTQKALAGKSGLSFSMISKLESGEQTNPSFETLRRIADVLRISPGQLLNNPLTIEEQIDEYIEYKRGIGSSIAKSAVNYGPADREEPCADLNFRKRMQAINNVPEPAVHDHGEYMDFLDLRPEMKNLFYALKNATKDEINQVTRLVETFRRI